MSLTRSDQASRRTVDPSATAASLTALLNDDDARVVAAAATALGRGAGGAEALGALAAAARRAPAAPAARARFAATAIAHRFDVAGFDPPPASGAPLPADARAGAATVVTAPGAEADLARRTLAAALPHARLTGPAIEVRCAGRNNLLLVAADSAGALAHPERFLTRRWNVGQLALHNPANGRWAPGLTVLTRPDGRGARLDLHRADGTTIYTGTGTVTGGALTAALVATSRPGAVAVSVDITVSAALGLRLAIRSATSRLPPRRPATAHHPG